MLRDAAAAVARAANSTGGRAEWPCFGAVDDVDTTYTSVGMGTPAPFLAVENQSSYRGFAFDGDPRVFDRVRDVRAQTGASWYSKSTTQYSMYPWAAFPLLLRPGRGGAFHREGACLGGFGFFFPPYALTTASTASFHAGRFGFACLLPPPRAKASFRRRSSIWGPSGAIVTPYS